MKMSQQSKQNLAGQQDSFMSFNHLVEAYYMTKRMQIKFAKMSDIQRTCYLLDRYANKKRVPARFQALQDYNPFKVIKSVNNILPKVDNVVDSMNDLTSKANLMMSAFSSTMLRVNDTLFGNETHGILMKLMNVIVNVCLARPQNMWLSLLYNISVQFGSTIYNLVSNYYEFDDKIKAEFQIDCGFLKDANLYGKISECVAKNQSICAMTLGAILSTILVAALGLPRGKSLSDSMAFFSKNCRSLKGMYDYSNVALPLFTAVGSYLMYSSFSNLEVDHELDNYLQGYNKWANDIINLDKIGEPMVQRVEKDVKLILQVDKLYKQGIEYASLLSTKRLTEKYSIHYHKLFKIIEHYQRICDYSGAFGNKPRTKPFCVWLVGESGVGKSGMSWPLACDMNCALSPDYESALNYSTNIYFRNVEQEFWDGYNGANIVVYDDFGQMADSQAKPNMEFMELIRCLNIAPFPLHMAQLEEKKRTKFFSKVVILTSNVLEQSTNSLTFPDAYRRRVDLCGRVINKPEYTKDGYSSTNGKIVKRLDPSKCESPVDTNCYLIEIYDAERKEPIVKDGQPWVVDYEEFLQLCLEGIRDSTMDSVRFNTELTSRITTEHFERIRKATFQSDLGELSAFDETNEFADVYEKSFVQDSIAQLRNIKFSEFKESLVSSLKTNINKVATINNSLIVMAMMIGGLGLWYFFKSDPAKPKRKHVTEAFSSSDPRTVSKRKFVTEAKVSGDNITRSKNKIVTEAMASGSDLTTNRRKVVTESIEVDMQAWKDATAQDLISHRISNNLYKIISLRDNRALLNGLFVRDNIMLTVKHLLNHLNIDDTIRLENLYGTVFEIPVRELKIVELHNGEFYKDAILIKFPRYVNAHTDLVKHFQKMPELQYRSADVCLLTLRCIRDKITSMILGNKTATFSSVVFDIEGKEHHIRDSLCYTLNTIGGDCGSPVIVNDNTFVRKIAGIHNMAATNGEEAFGQSITQNDLIKGLAEFDSIITDHDNISNFKLKNVNFQFNKEYTQEEFIEAVGLPAPTFNFVGSVSKEVFSPDKTSIRQSIIFDMVQEHVTKPCNLYSNDCDIMKKNIAKCSLNTPFIPTAEVDNAVQEVKSHLLSGARPELKRVLTYEEAIRGSDESIYISAINRASSAGYPWVLDKKPSTHGKTGWLGDDELFLYDEDVRKAVNHRIEQAKLGIRVPVLWTATLKDERRPIEKVDANKTRVFASGPMDYTIAVRQYFLGFMAHVMENRIKNEQSIGTNPCGLDWTKTAKKLGKYGKKVFAGDFSSFDGTLNSCILSRFVEIVNEFYNDGAENARVREVFMLDVFNSTWLCKGSIIGLTHSQPSGNPLTTILNSFYNSVSMRIAYYRAAKAAKVTPPFFDEVVSMVSYGDDNVINFSDGIVGWFNQQTVTEAYQTFGMIYTDEAKSGNITKYRELSEVAYLKRGFRYCNGIYRAPLELKTILETPNWIMKCPDSVLACQMNVEDSIRELAQHDEETFKLWSSKYIAAFYDKTGIYPKIQTYNSYCEEWDREMNLIV